MDINTMVRHYAAEARFSWERQQKLINEYAKSGVRAVVMEPGKPAEIRFDDLTGCYYRYDAVNDIWVEAGPPPCDKE